MATKKFNGKTYRSSGAVTRSKVTAKSYVKKAKAKGHNARIVTILQSGMRKKHYEIYIRKA